jgi:two-component system chemotaxis response regulator CheB
MKRSGKAAAGHPLVQGQTSIPGRYIAVAVGASAGGLEALSEILGGLSADFPLPILVAQHMHPFDDGQFAEHLGDVIKLAVCVPCDKETLRPGHVYIAPANYHMLCERDGTVVLSTDEKINYSRPSIDMLFESAAYAWGPGLIAIILSGANRDGTEGVRTVKALGGTAVAQSPESVEYPVMPRSAIRDAGVDIVLPSSEIAALLRRLTCPVAGSGQGSQTVIEGKTK